MTRKIGMFECDIAQNYYICYLRAHFHLLMHSFTFAGALLYFYRRFPLVIMNQSSMLLSK